MGARVEQRYPARGAWDEGMGQISGFGGGYEAACRNGLRAGLRWLDRHPDWKFRDKSSIWDHDNKSLADAIAKGCEPGGATGAQVATCFSHVIHIHGERVGMVGRADVGAWSRGSR